MKRSLFRTDHYTHKAAGMLSRVKADYKDQALVKPAQPTFLPYFMYDLDQRCLFCRSVPLKAEVMRNMISGKICRAPNGIVASACKRKM